MELMRADVLAPHPLPHFKRDGCDHYGA